MEKARKDLKCVENESPAHLNFSLSDPEPCPKFVVCWRGKKMLCLPDVLALADDLPAEMTEHASY